MNSVHTVGLRDPEGLPDHFAAVKHASVFHKAGPCRLREIVGDLFREVGTLRMECEIFKDGLPNPKSVGVVPGL